MDQNRMKSKVFLLIAGILLLSIAILMALMRDPRYKAKHGHEGVPEEQPDASR